MQVNLAHCIYFLLLNTGLVLGGYIIIKKNLLLLSYLLLVVSVLAVYLLFQHDAPVSKMVAIIATTFISIKVVAATQSYNNKKQTLKFTQWIVFATAWAGMRIQIFETLGSKPIPGGWKMIGFGISRMCFGGLLLFISHLIIHLYINQTYVYVAVTATALMGLSLILHFGILGISAGIWRLNGVNTYYLFKQPAKSKSLTEFWSKRWNIAFSEMTSIIIYRPLNKKYNNTLALILAFAFSGLLHELALSVPVNTGYGLPLLYFIIQAVIVLIEKRITRYNVSFLKNGVIAQAWVLFWLIAPIPLLFSKAFIKQIVWSLAGLQ